MISSKALIDQTGISRATLNNYIQLGILSKPVVMSHSDDAPTGAARLLGYFDLDSVDRIRAVQSLKAEGLSIPEIVEYLAENGIQSEFESLTPIETPCLQSKSVPLQKFSQIADTTIPSETPERHTMQSLPPLSLDTHSHPAYMLNYNLELTWLNEFARGDIFSFDKPPAHSNARNIFKLLADDEANLSLKSRQVLAELHLQIASVRLSQQALSNLLSLNDPAVFKTLTQSGAFAAAEPTSDSKLFKEFEYSKVMEHAQSQAYRVFSIYFREGILIIHTPRGEQEDALIDFLSRRDHVIRTLMRQQLPVMTSLAVLVADVQNSVRICSELPPDEYFELINQIWHTMSQVLRKYIGTHGKHAGDGAVYYFFPQPESNYLYNAICCADELRTAMLKINSEWQLRKNWLTELKLNIGLHEGQEWLGAFQSDHHIEFMVLGDTINFAARLSDFAKNGSVWATKNLISRLSAQERKSIEFGVLRRSHESGDRFVESSYAQIDSLIAFDQQKNEKLRDIAQLAVTEIRRVHTT